MLDCQVWAPTHIEQYLQVHQNNNLLLSELFPLALQHLELFEALIAWAQCFSSTYYKRDSFPTKEILRHRGKSIAELRKKLMSPSTFSVDAAIITTLFLMGLDVGQCTALGPESLVADLISTFRATSLHLKLSFRESTRWLIIAVDLTSLV